MNYELEKGRESEVFEKIARRGGKLFRVRFVVVERNGVLRGRVISCEPIETLSGEVLTKEKVCLPVFRCAKSAPVKKVRFQKIVSPFTTLDFLTSIKIRAPSCL